MCVPADAAAHPRKLSVGAVMAIHDDVGSFAYVAQDRTRRAGVSVSLSAQLHRDVSAGTEVLIDAQAVKIGKLLGFSEISMVDANTGALVWTNPNSICSPTHIDMVGAFLFG